ncbi:MAG: hypothetical protein HQL33_11815, partial [Alphaproteobacteria bacterium]|nr:hypothetical protein [Alphaproteobacteria bacterium]
VPLAPSTATHASSAPDSHETGVISGEAVRKEPAFVPPPSPSSGAFSDAVASATPLPAYGGAAYGGTGESYLIAVVPFGSSSTALVREDRLLIGDVVAAQREYGGTIRVVGFSSARQGSFQLSSARAEKVAGELLNQGAPWGSVIAEAFAGGGNPPVGANENRTEIYFDY